MDPAGDYVVTWLDNGPGGAHDSVLAARLYNSSGVPKGAMFQVNTFVTNQGLIGCKAAMDSAGNFAITWQVNNEAGISSGYDIYARRFNSAGVALGGEFRVNTYTTGAQYSRRWQWILPAISSCGEQNEASGSGDYTFTPAFNPGTAVGASSGQHLYDECPETPDGRWIVRRS